MTYASEYKRVSHTWPLSGPAAVFASLLSENGWCATPDHKSSSGGCKPVCAWGRTLQKHMRGSDKTKVYLLLYYFSQFVTENKLNHNVFFLL